MSAHVRASEGRRWRSHAHARGVTLLEVLVAVAILAMIALLIFGAFDSLSKGKKAEEARVDRARQGREASLRIARELTSAYLSMHNPPSTALLTRTTAFIGRPSSNFDRVDFAAFAHRRTDKGAKESDQAEIGFFVVKNPDKAESFDLVRREQFPIDLDPKLGGVVNVLAEDVESFKLKYLDPQSGLWTETWDTTQATGQMGRLPLEVRIQVVLKGVPGGTSTNYTTKVQIPVLAPLTFGISQ